jgi:hypothetical protein
MYDSNVGEVTNLPDVLPVRLRPQMSFYFWEIEIKSFLFIEKINNLKQKSTQKTFYFIFFIRNSINFVEN